MQITLGPWRWIEDDGFPEGGYHGMPEGARSALELGSAEGLTESTLCLFLAPDGINLPSEYEVLDDRPRSRRALQDAFGYRAQGTTLTEWLVDLLRNGDPDGLDRCKPAMPSTDNHLRLFLQQLAHEESFRFGQHPHTNQVQAVLQRDFRELATRELAIKGEAVHSRRVLDYWCDKYGLRKDDPAEWGMLVPADLRSEIEGLLRHATTINESFNKADGAGWGPDLPWNTRSGTLTTTSNRGTWSSTGNTQAEADAPLSSSDHYCQVKITAKTDTTGNGHGAVCRASGTGTLNQYLYRILGGTSIVSQCFRWVSGSAANIGSLNATVDVPAVLRLTCDGDQIGISYDSGTYTDTITNTAVTSGVVAGVRANDDGPAGSIDELEAADLAAPSTFTGTLSLTAAPATFSGEATVNIPATREGVLSLTAASAEMSMSGTTEVPVASASLIMTAAPSIFTSTATHEAPTQTATLSLTAAAAQLEATGQFSTVVFSASLSMEAAPAELAGQATFDAGTVSASMVLEAAPSEFASTSTHVPPTMAGTLSLTAASAEFSATGLFNTVVFSASLDMTAADSQFSGTATFTTADEPITVPNVAWQHWGPILLMMDEGAGAPVAGASSIAWEIPINELSWAVPDNALFWEVEA